MVETFPKYAPHKYGGPPTIAKQFSPKTTHVISDDDDDKVIKKKHTLKHANEKHTNKPKMAKISPKTHKTHKTVEQKKKTRLKGKGMMMGIWGQACMLSSACMRGLRTSLARMVCGLGWVGTVIL